jgi:membrane protein DedA with SNARE-associated domain
VIEELDSLVRQSGPLGLLVLFFAAFLEYVFPPFPGDTITLLGGVYAVRGTLPEAAVFGSIFAGSLLGASLDYGVGRVLATRILPRAARGRFFSADQLQAWQGRFQKHGTWLLLANRFLPGMRAPVFFAAGACFMPLGRVLLLGGISSLAWNGLLFAAGHALGGQIEQVEALVQKYSLVATALLVSAALVIVVRAVVLRLRRKRAPLR